MNLQHHFLIAMPALQDPIFRRAVVYICEYNEDGAMGIIINKPLENLQVEGILDNAWLTAPADMNILFKTPIADRWRDAAKLIGIDILTMPGVAGHA